MSTNTSPSHISHFDGGQVALLGFLYQMMGVAALQAWAMVPPQGGNANQDFEPLTAVIQHGELRHEWSDQDAVAIADPQELSEFTDADACNVIQFKFSQVRAVLDMGDVKTMIGRMRDGILRWPSGQPTPTGFWIITNRPISLPVKKLMAISPNARTLPGLNDHDLQILRGLHIKCEVQFAEWETKLIQLAQLFGVFEDEVYERIPKLIGELVRKSAGGELASVSRELVCRAITGCSDPYLLTCDQIASKTRVRLEDRAELLSIEDTPGVPIRRDHLLRQVEEKAASHALVILVGGGGSGKSVLLWQMLSDILGDRACVPRACAEFLPVDDVRVQNRLWSWIIAEWANAEDGNKRYAEEPKRALERLRLANPGVSKPLLFLGLDGLDERSASEPRLDSIVALLQWFWQAERQIVKAAQQGNIVRPEATLIVTCRDPDEIERWLDIPPATLTPSGDATCVIVGGFTDEELKNAAHVYLPEVAPRFATLSAPSDGHGSRALINPSLVLGAMPLGVAPLGGMPIDSNPPVSGEAVLALRHPVMWQALGRLSAAQRLQALDGAPDALRGLAKAFIDWFIYRVKRRGALKVLNDDHLRQLLHGIAGKCPSRDTDAHSLDDWTSSARSTGLVTELPARTAWNEALSGGLIELDASKTWRWRHAFVHEYLADPKSCEQETMYG